MNGTTVIGTMKVTEEQKKNAKKQLELLKKLKPMPDKVKKQIEERTYNK